MLALSHVALFRDQTPSGNERRLLSHPARRSKAPDRGAPPMSRPHWSAEVSAYLDHVLAHVPDSMLTVVVVGISLAAAAIGVLALVSTTRDKNAHY
jgi:hypothetical protein